jgi:hypothetical protein
LRRVLALLAALDALPTSHQHAALVVALGEVVEALMVAAEDDPDLAEIASEFASFTDLSGGAADAANQIATAFERACVDTILFGA